MTETEKNMETTNCTIRPATKADLTDIVKFIRELAEYENLLDEVEANEEILYDSLFVRKKAEASMICHDGEAIGYALYFYNFSTFTGRPGLYVEDIYLTPRMRGKGFGKQIFSYLAEVARNENCARMEWACLDWNEPSIAFYKGMGARAMDEWTVYRLTGDEIVRLSEKQ
jgi:GNAT superfamily N-acetyltransferase